MLVPLIMFTTVFFPGGIPITEKFASPSWVYTLLTHEVAHLYQLNVKAPVSSLFHKIFRNSVFAPVIPPVFLVPNIFLPNYIVEGNATYNESRFGLGGRLHSGEIRAVVYHLIKNHKITLPRLTNLHLEFPFGTESYFMGGYFASYLSEIYGHHATNSFFKYNARHTTIPFLFNETFKEIFSKDAKRLVNEFLTYTEKKASKQKSITSVPIAKGLGCSDFNHDGEKVYFLSNPDHRSPNRLNILDKRTQKLTQRQTQLPTGKVFFIKGKGFFSATSNIVNPTDTLYSLYGEKIYRLKDFDSKWVNDMRGKKTVYTDIQKSLHQFHISVSRQNDLFERTFSTTANSAPILDEKGNVYYFKQKKDRRFLYKNKRILFSFKGFYSRLMEASPKGHIYFIANTPYGSSLFVFKKRKVFRVFSSDTVVQARKLDKNAFLVCQVFNKGYKYEILSKDLMCKKELPAYYYYKHEDPKLKTFFTGSLDKEKDMPDSPLPLNNKITYKNYDSFRHFRYKNLTLLLSNSLYVTSLFFGDPLSFQQVHFSFKNNRELEIFQLDYLNNKYYLPWGLQLLWSFREPLTIFEKSKSYKEFVDRKKEISFSFNIPIHKNADWSSYFNFGVSGGEDDLSVFLNARKWPMSYNYLGLNGSIHISWKQHYPLGRYPHRWFYINYIYGYQHRNYLKNELKIKIKREKKNQLLDIGSGYHLGREFYLIGSSVYGSYIQNDSLEPEQEENFKFPKPIHLPPLRIESKHTYNENILSGLSLGLEKVINYSKYFAQIPIGLRRFSPLIHTYHFFKTWNGERPLYNLSQLEYGLFLEFLLIYKSPFQIKISQKINLNTDEDKTKFLWSLNFKL